MITLRDQIAAAKSEGERVAAVAAFELAESSHRNLCAQQAEQLRQIYFRQFYQRMRNS